MITPSKCLLLTSHHIRLTMTLYFCRNLLINVSLYIETSILQIQLYHNEVRCNLVLYERFANVILHRYVELMFVLHQTKDDRKNNKDARKKIRRHLDVG